MAQIKKKFGMGASSVLVYFENSGALDSDLGP